MDIHKVNASLLKGISMMQQRALGEAYGYTGDGGNFGSPEPDLNGSPDVGGDNGVDNYSSDGDQFDEYVDYAITSIMNKCGVTEEEAGEAFVSVAMMQAKDGRISDIPDLDSASSEALATWAGAAKTLGLESIAAEYVSKVK